METGEVTVGASQPAAPSGPRAEISVVTPSRNQGRYLDETIASVLGQEGNFALDYLVIDGASTDRSVDVLRRYESRLRQGDWPLRCRSIRFRWLSEPDRGQSHALAKGLHMSTGDVLGWLNSDDTYQPRALATVCETFAHDSACAVVYGNAHYIDDSGAPLGDYPTEAFSSERLAVVNFLAQPSTFFRRKAIEHIGGPDIGLHYVMDYDLWLRMAKSGPFRYVEAFLSNYRLHNESKTVAAQHALENARECLHVVHKHCGWAPANRVYEFCSQWVKASLPSPTLTKQPMAAMLTAPLALAKYCAMNRGVRLADLKLLTRRNARRLFEKQRLY